MTRKLVMFSVAIFVFSTQAFAVNLVAGARGSRAALAELQPSSKSVVSTVEAETVSRTMGFCPVCGGTGCNCQLTISEINERMQVQGQDLLDTTIMALQQGIPLSAESLEKIELINSLILSRQNRSTDSH